MQKTFILIILIFSAVYLGYFFLMALGVFKNNKKKIINKRKNNFAILIAARNEEEVIGNLINSLKKQNYPKDKYEIYVIVNNCIDNTKKVAEESGASILECTSFVKSKGDVLKFAFNKLKDKKNIDAYAIFDADNIVHKDFLKKMNDMLNRGYSVAQGFRDTKNVSDNWLSSSYAILYYLQNLFINKARYNLDMSSFLNGTGFVVKKDVIDKYGFNPVTLTEDIEFTIMCATNDEKIAFVEDAIIYDEQVTHFVDSLKQRKRWSFGTMQCIKIYGWNLIKKGFKEKNIECFDVILFNLLIVIQVIITTFSIISSIIVLFLSEPVNLSLKMYLIIPIIVYIIGVIFRIIVIKKCNKNLKDNISGILLFDIFLLSWIPINFICLFKKSCDWDQIKHSRNIKAEDLNI